MKPVSKKADVRVIVGRFQLPYLHVAHKELIQSVIDIDTNSEVIVFLGLGTVPCLEDALDYQSRQKMFEEEFGDKVRTAYILDCPGDDERWAKNLDEQITALTGPQQSVVLYGGRDSFISRYGGKYECIELEQEHWVSATEIRNMCKNKPKGSADFRYGVFWAYWQRYPAVYPTADVAVFKDDYTKILLVRKAHEKLFRFCGGFRDKCDSSDEAGASRELSEELPSVRIDDKITRHNYVGSITVKDPRYDGTRDCIATRLFAVEYSSGTCEPADDLANGETKWFDYNAQTFDITQVVQEHRPLFQHLAGWVSEQKELKEFRLWKTAKELKAVK